MAPKRLTEKEIINARKIRDNRNAKRRNKIKENKILKNVKNEFNEIKKLPFNNQIIAILNKIKAMQNSVRSGIPNSPKTPNSLNRPKTPNKLVMKYYKSGFGERNF